MCNKECVTQKRKLLFNVGGSVKYPYYIALHGNLMQAETFR
jgi:hypothetical protein